MLLHSIDDSQIIKVDDFGQLPGDIIFRKTEDFYLYTLEDYLKTQLQNKNIDEDESKNNIDSDIEDDETIFQRKSTVMTETETIDIILRVISLIEILHSKGIIHTNINPGEIFFKTIDDLDTLCFNSLYH